MTTHYPFSVPEDQAGASVSTAAPAQNTWYDAVTVTNAELLAVSMLVEAANETLEWRVNVDGNVYRSIALACNHSSYYNGYRYAMSDATTKEIACRLEAATNLSGKTPLAKGESITLQYRKTTALGANPLHCYYKFAKYR